MEIRLQKSILKGTRGGIVFRGIVFECNGLEGDICNDEVHDNDEGGDDNDFLMLENEQTYQQSQCYRVRY